MNTIRVVGAVILDSAGQVLVAKRKASQTNGGFWEFPGGKVEQDESDENALRRELQEELGIHAEVGDFIASSLIQYDHVNIELSTYFIKSYVGEPVALEHEKVLFADVRSLKGLSFTPANLKTIGILESQ